MNKSCTFPSKTGPSFFFGAGFWATGLRKRKKSIVIRNRKEEKFVIVLNVLSSVFYKKKKLLTPNTRNRNRGRGRTNKNSNDSRRRRVSFVCLLDDDVMWAMFRFISHLPALQSRAACLINSHAASIGTDCCTPLHGWSMRVGAGIAFNGSESRHLACQPLEKRKRWWRQPRTKPLVGMRVLKLAVIANLQDWITFVGLKNREMIYGT